MFTEQPFQALFVAQTICGCIAAINFCIDEEDRLSIFTRITFATCLASLVCGICEVLENHDYLVPLLLSTLGAGLVTFLGCLGVHLRVSRPKPKGRTQK